MVKQKGVDRLGTFEAHDQLPAACLLDERNELLAQLARPASIDGTVADINEAEIIHLVQDNPAIKFLEGKRVSRGIHVEFLFPEAATELTLLCTT
jgi:hypothetical protein